MKVAVFSTKSYDRNFLESANIETKHELVFIEPRLTMVKPWGSLVRAELAQ